MEPIVVRVETTNLKLKWLGTPVLIPSLDHNRIRRPYFALHRLVEIYEACVLSSTGFKREGYTQAYLGQYIGCGVEKPDRYIHFRAAQSCEHVEE